MKRRNGRLPEATGETRLESNRHARLRGAGITRAGKTRLRSLDDLDHRTAAAQRARTLVAALLTELGNDPTTGQHQLAQRAALLSAMLEDAEAKWVTGEEIDLGEYGFLVNTQRRVLTTIGLERRARDVSRPLGPEAVQALIEAVRETTP